MISPALGVIQIFGAGWDVSILLWVEVGRRWKETLRRGAVVRDQTAVKQRRSRNCGGTGITLELFGALYDVSSWCVAG